MDLVGMRNPQYWRERTVETERRKLERHERYVLFEATLANKRQSPFDLGWARSQMKRMGLPMPPTVRQIIRRERRKVKRMENGTYRRRNRCG